MPTCIRVGAADRHSGETACPAHRSHHSSLVYLNSIIVLLVTHKKRKLHLIRQAMCIKIMQIGNLADTSLATFPSRGRLLRRHYEEHTEVITPLSQFYLIAVS